MKIVFVVVALLCVIYALITNKSLFGLFGVFFLILGINCSYDDEKTITNVKSVTIDTIYTIAKTDTVKTYNITYIK